ncbi:hypothetical protein DIZ81_03110 [Legionella taurinensis]|uniref:Uncharacterized protein n=1 Tax=Legionella taurinensis TaxID=70611 RepID=A0A3A5LIC3_9GAMM|nr:hypothetical protein [Legionella taurinensis]MDX1836136.1 hypothetical protein [Legionella taurinensis]PUT42092.1 hypothetical protein DB744_03115 [Legionella taurinensis]PUT44879.1 hypothetical protein DB746_03115 [Legionella taurinensis]PUT48200.1 hypothetical protein DB743_01275 [Legionella taurinensis]PUT49014.1 hypothetical protein DB745_03115 [Legionella taurinensis]
MRFFTGFFNSAVSGQQTGRFVKPDSDFDYQSSIHIKIVNQQVERFSKALADLQAVDAHILVGTGAAVFSWLTCGFLPLVTVGMVASAYAGYCAHSRKEYASDYKEALEDLIAVYQWAMGKNSDKMWYKLGTRELQNLIVTLGPWVNTDTIHTWRKEDMQPSTLAKLTTSRRTDISEETERQLLRLAEGVHMNSAQFRLYGEGSVDTLLSSIKDNAMAKITELTTGPKQS